MFVKQNICSKITIDKQMYVRYNQNIKTNVRIICSVSHTITKIDSVYKY